LKKDATDAHNSSKLSGLSAISGRMVRSMVEHSGLQPVIQTATWGPNHEYNCLKFNDQISVLKKA
jgi:hypothetical protein